MKSLELKNTVSEKKKTSVDDSIAKRNKILKNCTELQGTMGKYFVKECGAKNIGRNNGPKHHKFSGRFIHTD